MKRKKFVLGIILVSLLGVCGCNMIEKNNDSKAEDKNNTETKEKKYNLEDVVLNERQKEILTERDLSTNYEELNYTQKRAIVAIEEALLYLENKYNTSFKYVGYIAPGPLDKEKVIAAPKNGTNSIYSFDVIKTEEGYSDDYMLILQRESYEEYLKNKVIKEEGINDIRVFSELSKTELTQIPEELDYYEGNVSSSNCIFIYDSRINVDNATSYIERIENLLNEKKLYGSTRIVLLKDNKIEEINDDNFDEYFEDEFILKQKIILVSR